MIGPRPERTIIPFISGGSSYPSVANSLLLVDFANSCTDANGLTLATDGQAVRTLRLLPGWGASLGDGLLRQEAGAFRPTWRADGLQGDGSDDRLTLPATLSLPGAFTVWAVVKCTGSVTSVTTLAGSTAPFDGAICGINSSGMRAFNPDASYNQTLAITTTGVRLLRIRRTAANAMFFAATGTSETARSSTSHNWQLDRILYATGAATESAHRVQGIMVVSADAVTDGTSAAAEAWLLARFGVAL